MANTAGLAKMTFTITEIYKRSVTSNSTGKEKALSKKKKKPRSTTCTNPALLWNAFLSCTGMAGTHCLEVAIKLW